MAKLVFRLNGVTEEEADEVRALLQEHGFETYETTAGRWGVSMAGIWLVNNEDKAPARELIEAYQRERQQRLRSEYEQAREEGRAETLWQRWREEPLTAVLVLIGLLVVLGLSTVPFLRFTGWL